MQSLQVDQVPMNYLFPEFHLERVNQLLLWHMHVHFVVLLGVYQSILHLDLKTGVFFEDHRANPVLISLVKDISFQTQLRLNPTSYLVD